MKFDSWEATIDKIRGLLQAEFGRHPELLKSDKLTEYEMKYFSEILDGRANEVGLASSLENLSKMLFKHYGKAPEKELQGDGTYLCEVSIPNREIAAVYKSEILSQKI